MPWLVPAVLQANENACKCENTRDACRFYHQSLRTLPAVARLGIHELTPFTKRLIPFVHFIKNRSPHHACHVLCASTALLIATWAASPGQTQTLRVLVAPGMHHRRSRRALAEVRRAYAGGEEWVWWRWRLASVR